MDKPQSDFNFRGMALMFKFRDLFKPRMKVLEEIGIKSGYYVLDYGCGSGSYIEALAKLVGPSGKIYALDMHPLAIQMTQKIAARKRITNVNTILSDCKTNLVSNSLDMVLLYDTLHALSEPISVLRELHRVLKPNGILSCSDHHMKEAKLISAITQTGLFKIAKLGLKTYSFFKI